MCSCVASQVALVVKKPPANADVRDTASISGLAWRRAWQPTPVFLPGESQGQRSLAGYGLWGRRELHMAERPTTILEPKNRSKRSVTVGAPAASREKPTQQRGPSTARNKIDAQTQTARSLCIWLLLFIWGSSLSLWASAVVPRYCWVALHHMNVPPFAFTHQMMDVKGVSSLG